MRSPDVHDDVPHESDPAADPDRRSRRLGDARRRLVALAQRSRADGVVPQSVPRDVAEELAALAQELTVAHEQLRLQTTELERARARFWSPNRRAFASCSSYRPKAKSLPTGKVSFAN